MNKKYIITDKILQYLSERFDFIKLLSQKTEKLLTKKIYYLYIKPNDVSEIGKYMPLSFKVVISPFEEEILVCLELPVMHILEKEFKLFKIHITKDRSWACLNKIESLNNDKETIKKFKKIIKFMKKTYFKQLEIDNKAQEIENKERIRTILKIK